MLVYVHFYRNAGKKRYSICMNATKEQFKKYLSEEKEMVIRIMKMVPREREDYPIAAGEYAAIEEIMQKLSVYDIVHVKNWMQDEKQNCMEEVTSNTKEEEIYPSLGKAVIYDTCLQWLKKDHRPIINHIYLP